MELPSEISFTTFGGYLGKKALSYVGEKFGSTITEAASKVGISEETVGKALSGDISGAIEQGTQEVTGAVEGAIGQAQEMVGEGISQVQGVISSGLEEGAGILGKISGNLENIPSIIPSSIIPEVDVSNMYNQGLEDLRSQMGIDEASFRDFTNVSIENSRPFSFNNPSQAGQEVEMTDFANVGTPSTTEPAESTIAGEGAEEGAEAVGESVAETIGEAAAETAGAEAVGAGLDATGILAPLGALVGVIGGIVGFFEGRKEESETMPVIPTPILNPSSQFL